MTYIDYTKSGGRLLGERTAPHNIVVNGVNVRFEGDISNKAFDAINAAGLVTHSLVARRDFACVSEDAALEVAHILDENPVYAPPAVDHSRPRLCPDCGRKMAWDGRFFYCEHCEGWGGIMYAKLEEVTLVHPSKYRPVEGDHPIYERGLNGDRVFTFDPEPSQYDSAGPKRYGLGYIGPNGDVCIVPDLWDENDSWIARNTVRPDWLIFEVKRQVGRVVVADGAVYSADAADSAGWRPFDAIQVNGVMYARLDGAAVIHGFAAKAEDLPAEAGAVAMQDLDGRWWSVALAVREEA